MSTLDTIESDIKQAVAFAETLAQSTTSLQNLVLSGLAAIAALTSNTTDDEAVAVLKGIDAIIIAIGNGISGRITPEEAEAAIATLRPSLAGNDAKNAAALAARFDHGAP